MSHLSLADFEKTPGLKVTQNDGGDPKAVEK